MTEKRQEIAIRLQGLAAGIASLLGPNETFRLLLASSLTIGMAVYKPTEIAELLREAASLIDEGGLDQRFIQ